MKWFGFWYWEELFDFALILPKRQYNDYQVAEFRRRLDRGVALRTLNEGSRFAYRTGEGILVAGGIAIAIANEPADWLLTIHDALNHGFSPYHALAVVPLVPGTISKVGRRVEWDHIYDGMQVTADEVLDMAISFLGDYREIKPGVFRSVKPDGCGYYRQVRMTEHELTGKHLNFELWTPNKHYPRRWDRRGNKHVGYTE
jgi:hypothetical protein